MTGPTPVRYGAFCARCNRTYLTSQWPPPTLCAHCHAGVAEAYRAIGRSPSDTEHDLPLGFSWIST